MFNFETLGPSQFEMRPYQDIAIQKAIQHFFSTHADAGIIQLATGCGKTPMAGELIRRCIQQGYAHRILVLAHRDELVVQACNTLEACGLAVGREQGSLRADALFPAQVVVSTVQTMMRRLESWDKNEFQLIIADEAHNYGAKRFKETLLHFNAKLLGITATIDRADKKSLEHFGDVIYSYSLWDAIHDEQGPFLTPLKFIRINMGADLRECRTIGRKGDFDIGELGRLIQPHIELFANAIVQEIGDKKTMIFMPCVNSSSAMASALNQLEVEARWVSGDHKDRKAIVEGYKQGDFQVIVNCNLLGEGFDDKATECVVLRPTKSRIVYCQQVGRATRLHPGKKFARIIDFNHTSDMDLIGPSSLAQLEKPVADKVDKIMAKNSDVSLWEAVDRAKEEIKREREELQVSINRLHMQYRRVEVSPFQVASHMGVLMKTDTFSDRATDKQVDLLQKHGIKEADLLTKKQASKMIESMISRRQAGLCTVKQLNLLVSLGVKPFVARNMSFQEASENISKLLGRSA